jgi:hypothetical protein
MPTKLDMPSDPAIADILHQPVDEELAIGKHCAALADAFENELAIGGHDAVRCGKLSRSLAIGAHQRPPIFLVLEISSASSSPK